MGPERFFKQFHIGETKLMLFVIQEKKSLINVLNIRQECLNCSIKIPKHILHV